jgi:hypothetical protein
MKIAPRSLAPHHFPHFPAVVSVYYEGVKVECLIIGLIFNDDIFSHSTIFVSILSDNHRGKFLQGLYQELLYPNIPPLDKLLGCFGYPENHMDAVMKEKYETVEERVYISSPGKDKRCVVSHKLKEKENVIVENKEEANYDIQDYNYCERCDDRLINPIVRNECGCKLLCRSCAVKHDGNGYYNKDACQTFKETHSVFFNEGMVCDGGSNETAIRYVGMKVKSEDIKPGMIYVTDWCHETGSNVEFYKVIRINKKSITLLRMKDETGETPYYEPSLKKTNGISGEKKINFPTDYFYMYVNKY